MKKWKLRAEVFIDIVMLLDKPDFKTHSFIFTRDENNVFELEFLTEMNEEEIQIVIFEVDDSHVMSETVQPIESYTGIR